MNPFFDFKSEIKLFLIVALFAVVLAIGGILLLQGGLGPSSPTLSSPTPVPTLSPQPLDTSGAPRDQAELDFAGWQTYRNEEFGFEVEYPSVLSVSEGSNDILLFFKDSSGRLTMGMMLTSAPGIRCHPDAKEDMCKVISIDEGVEITIRSFDIAPTEATIQLSDEVALYFVLRCENNKYEDDTPEGVSFCIISQERRVLFEQILSTFRFAPPAP